MKHKTQSDLPRVLSPAQVRTALGVSQSTLDRMTRSGRFPKAAAISPGRVGWLDTEIKQWLAARFSGAQKTL